MLLLSLGGIFGEHESPTPTTTNNLPWWRSKGNLFTSPLGAVHRSAMSPTEFDFDFINPKADHYFRSVIDTLADRGITVLALNTVYDSGLTPLNGTYDPECLEKGLAISDLTSVNQYFATQEENTTLAKQQSSAEENLRALIDYAHETHDMKVISWTNLDYVWSGGPFWKQAVADVATYMVDGDLSSLPKGSPARSFAWDASNTTTDPAHPSNKGAGPCWCQNVGDVCPAEPLHEWTIAPDNLNTNTTKNCGVPSSVSGVTWIWVPDVELCVPSAYSRMPIGDIASESWGRYVIDGFNHFIDLGLDGFYMDAVEATEEGMDYVQSQTYLREIFEAVKAHAHPIPISIVLDFPGPPLTMYGADIAQYHRAGMPLTGFGIYESETNILQIITEKNAMQLDVWFHGVDHAQRNCVLFSGLGRDENDAGYVLPGCVTALMRIPLLGEDEGNNAKMNQLMVGLAIAGGYAASMDCILWNNATLSSPYLNAGPYNKTPVFTYSFDEQSFAGRDDMSSILDSLGIWDVSPDVLRAPAFTTFSDSIYSLIKYDAFGSGRVDIFVVNLDPDAEFYVIPNAALPEGVDAGFSQYLNLEPMSMKVKPLGMATAKGKASVGTWAEVTRTNSNGENMGHLQCDPTRLYSKETGGPRTLAECMLLCLGDVTCRSIEVQWADIGVPGIAAGDVSNTKAVCRFRADVDPDPQRCTFDDPLFQTFQRTWPSYMPNSSPTPTSDWSYMPTYTAPPLGWWDWYTIVFISIFSVFVVVVVVSQICIIFAAIYQPQVLSAVVRGHLTLRTPPG